MSLKHRLSSVLIDKVRPRIELSTCSLQTGQCLCIKEACK